MFSGRVRWAAISLRCFSLILDAVPGLCFVRIVGGVCLCVFVLCGGELVCDLYELRGEFCECCV